MGSVGGIKTFWETRAQPLWRMGKRRRLRHAWEIAHETRQSTGTGLTISRLARPIRVKSIHNQFNEKSVEF